ncbi:hypothetical protein [Parafrankia discariae]|uniref:hypothetical protein n=1 Tax=Parafrankia discariae TaxID=365528 RepID=UPI00039F9F91|nr:hypothetical protein [Parafrankia discariae]
MAPQVSEDVYQGLADAGKTSSTRELLHGAVRRLRGAAAGHSPAVRAPHIHIGP